ncbi:hypothetical protein SteCoe_4003 [Stentor coeruleus]|uniref:Cyclic nucleotide-binding domain-containing protein n=1 Tax=Stentor coeruleus TaxID=5963 RepID=A0A1R2BXP4_9CILI|nr:hypothetical protein SteCoe_17925 [Stentor coeruleus]OMJ93063.1 hypothetical protein SteCoe_4003 [Stentor coeruleus]
MQDLPPTEERCDTETPLKQDPQIKEQAIKTDSSKHYGVEIFKFSRRYKLSVLNHFEKTQTSEFVSSHCSVIHPQSKFKKFWDCIMVILLLYTATIMPYRIAFIEGTVYDSWWWLDNTLNLLFFIDFLVNCISAYYDELDNLIYNHKKILLNYMKGWMLIDLIGCIPMDFFMESTSSSGYNNLLRLFRLPRLYRLLRISKIFKLMQQYKNSEIMMKLQDFFNIKQSVARLIGVFVTVLICVHIFACMWVFLPKLEDYSPRSWLVRGSFLDENQYIISIYWCFVTFSTVGYGDITPGTSAEIIIAIFWMLFGICFYSFIIGSLASILSSLETRETSLMNKLSAIDEFSKEINLSKTLRLKIRYCVKSTHDYQSFNWTEQKDIFFELPKNLRYEIALFMHQGSAKFLNFFKYRNSNFISSVVPFLSHTVIVKDNYVYKIGEYADEIYFLLRGKVEFRAEANDEEFVLLALLPGANFGEIEIIKQSNRAYSLKCCAKSSLLIMNYDIIEYIKSEFQTVWRDMVVQAYENDKILNKLKENIPDIKDLSKSGSNIKNLKELNEYIDVKISKELLKDENWNLGKDLLTDEEVSTMNIENIKIKVQSINFLSCRINKRLDLIIEQLSKRNSEQESFFEEEENCGKKISEIENVYIKPLQNSLRIDCDINLDISKQRVSIDSLLHSPEGVPALSFNYN